ncbi:MAG: ferrous iron transporter B, partial [Oscillospiraceae bacterium]|nr:ferrous iron transporter B [Oscillospiraceae bacterium]
ASVVISGIMLKKFKAFAGDPSPFVMELPAYHVPSVKNVLRATWERGWSFIKRAGSVIFISSIIIWFLSSFGFGDEGFGMVEDMDASLLAVVGGALAWIFVPVGFGNWQATVATITGLVAKEEVVGTMGVLYGNPLARNVGEIFTGISGYSFMMFNLYCAPCFAAIGAIKREMNNVKWTLGAVAYMCIWAYVLALITYNLVGLFFGVGFNLWTVIAAVCLAAVIYLLVRPNPYDDKHLSMKEKVAQ